MIHGTVHGVFRSIVSAGWNVKSSGDVEASTGHFAIVEIPDHAGERAGMRDAVFLDDPVEAEIFDSIPAGWFLVIESFEGNVGLVKADDKNDAEQLFQMFETDYVAWAGSGK